MEACSQAHLHLCPLLFLRRTSPKKLSLHPAGEEVPEGVLNSPSLSSPHHRTATFWSNAGTSWWKRWGAQPGKDTELTAPSQPRGLAAPSQRLWQRGPSLGLHLKNLELLMPGTVRGVPPRHRHPRCQWAMPSGGKGWAGQLERGPCLPPPAATPSLRAVACWTGEGGSPTCVKARIGLHMASLATRMKPMATSSTLRAELGPREALMLAASSRKARRVESRQSGWSS